MTRYVALLRGINVGGKHKVEMKRLRDVLSGLGFADVSTFINSGNAFFSATGSAAALTSRIEKALRAEFGFEIPVTLRTKDKFLRTAAALRPEWTNDVDQFTYVFFLWPKFDKRATVAALKPREGVDTLVYVPGAIIWHFPRKLYGRSAINKIAGTEFYRGSSSRNANSTRKMVALLKSGKQKSTG